MPDKSWDDTDWQQGDELTSSEWSSHVEDGHFPADELNFSVNSDGNPVILDPQNSNAEIAEYDRGTGEWVLSSVRSDAVRADSVITNAIYQNPDDIPAEYEQEGAQVYTVSDGLVVFESDS